MGPMGLKAVYEPPAGRFEWMGKTHKKQLAGAVVEIVGFDGRDMKYKVEAPCPWSRRGYCKFWVDPVELRLLEGTNAK